MRARKWSRVAGSSAWSMGWARFPPWRLNLTSPRPSFGRLPSLLKIGVCPGAERLKEAATTVSCAGLSSRRFGPTQLLHPFWVTHSGIWVGSPTVSEEVSHAIRKTFQRKTRFDRGGLRGSGVAGWMRRICAHHSRSRPAHCETRDVGLATDDTAKRVARFAPGNLARPDYPWRDGRSRYQRRKRSPARQSKKRH